MGRVRCSVCLSWANPCEPCARTAERINATPPEPAAPERDEVPAEVHERGWQWRPVGDGAFAPPFGTVRACVDCGCLVAGGPTRCGRCAPEPAAQRVSPEDWQRLGEMQETAREVGERLAEVRERFGLEPDEAEREARAYWEHWASPDAAIASLATLLRAAEARGRERGLEEAARECERQRDGYAAERDECSRRGLTHLAQADQDKVSALVHAAVSIRALRSGR